MKTLTGQIACVTGAAGGIASAIVRQLAQAGAHLALLDVDQDRLRALVTSLREQGTQVSMAVTDLNAEDGVKRGISQALTPFDGQVDMLVASVGSLVSGRFLDLSTEDWQRSLLINLLSHIWATQAVLPMMKQQRRGRILYIGSDQGSQPDIGLSAYAAPKAALHNLAIVLARELAPDGIMVSALAPGMTRTALVERLMDGYAEEFGTDRAEAERREIARRGIPLGRLGEPDEIAQLALVALQNDFLTGSIINISGGNRRSIA